MVFILHKYIFRELLKVFAPAALALTLILSLGSVLRPMQEFGVGPRQAVHIMGYFLPVTLTFVLPIAALFAGALVYGRLAGDNELDACKASGIGFLRLVYPGLALALIVAIANLILSFHVTPIFVHLAEKSLKADAKQIVFRNIQRRGYYELPDSRYRIYADYADPQTDTLVGVLVAQVQSGRIEDVFGGDAAKVYFNPHGQMNEVRVVVHKPYKLGLADEGAAEWLPFTWEFGSLLGDDIKFKRIDQMRAIEADLMRFGPVNKLVRETYAQFVTELLAQDIARELGIVNRESQRDPRITNHEPRYELRGEPNSVRFTATQCAVQARAVELSGDVAVSEYDANYTQLLYRLRSAKASLYIEGDGPALTLTMDIYRATEEGSGQLRMRHVIRGLTLPASVTDVFKTGNILEDIRPQVLESALEKGPSENLRQLHNELQRRIRITLIDIKAEIHSRLAFGMGCVPMILIGIGLGVIKKGGHMLSAFAASCVPAAVLIVCIISGKQVTENLGSQAISGTLLTWAGLVVLVVLAIVLYHRLLRN
jgi:lipopolysaccharide export LptBFGC system permease protein LptF